MQKRQAEAAAPADDLLEQLRPLTEGRRPQSGVPVLPEAGASGPPQYGVRPRNQQPTYSTGSRPRSSARSLIDTLGYDPRYAQQADLAQFREMADMQQLQEREAAQLEQEQLQQASLASRQQQEDVPQWIQQGMASGSLRYSPAQLRERQSLSDSIDKVYSDPRWSPAQRARFEATQRQKIRQIDLAPQTVPINERPVTPQQQFEQSVVTWTDQTTGKKITGFMGMRSGAPDFKPFQDDSAKMELEQQKFQAKQMADEQKVYHEAIRDQMRGEHEERMLNRQMRADAMRQRIELQRDISKAKAQMVKDKAAAARDAIEIDLSSSEKELEDMEAMLKTIVVPPEWRPAAPPETLSPIQPLTPGITQTSPMVGAAPTSEGPPQWYLDLPPGSEYPAPDGTTRIKP